MKVIVSDGKAYVTDERWVTIGGEDNDGSGQHVLIKENGTIVAGFGTGRNVRNAFGKANTPEKANEAVKQKKSEFDHKKASYDELENRLLKNREKLRNTTNPQLQRRLINENHDLMTEMDNRWNKTEAAKKNEAVKKAGEIKAKHDALRKEYDTLRNGLIERYNKGELTREQVNNTLKEKFGDKAKEMLKLTKERAEVLKGVNTPLSEKLKKANTPEKANEAIKQKTFTEATKRVNERRSKEESVKIERAKETLKDIDKRIAEAKKAGDDKRVSFLQATKNRAENKVNKSGTNKSESPYIKKRDALYKEYATSGMGQKALLEKLSELDRKHPKDAGEAIFKKEAPNMIKRLEENRKAMNKIAREEGRRNREARKQGKLTVPFSLNHELWAKGGENSAILADFKRRYKLGQIDKATYRKAIVASEGNRSWMLDDLDNEE